MLVYQRMNPDTSLEAVVKKLVDSRPDFLPDNKRITEGTLSANTSTDSQARSRLPCHVAEWFAGEVSRSLMVVSYNLVTQFRRQAAELVDLPPRRMSFKRT